MSPVPQLAGSPEQIVAAAHEQIRPVLRAFFRRRIADAHEVDDLVQEVFLRLVRRGGFTEDDNMQAYAFSTAQSVLLDRARYRRSRQSDRHIEFDVDLHAESEQAFEDTLVARETLADAASVLAQLPERCRRVFLLRRVDGLGMKEIADQLGISLSSAEKDMKRATLHLVKSRRRAQ